MKVRKLTLEDVRYIRTSPKPAAQIARILSVNPRTVSAVRLGEIWKHAEFIPLSEDLLEEIQEQYRKAQVRGELHGSRKLTENDVREIYREPKTKSLTDLARKYNVSKPTISRIRSGRIWSHVTLYEEQ